MTKQDIEIEIEVALDKSQIELWRLMEGLSQHICASAAFTSLLALEDGLENSQLPNLQHALAATEAHLRPLQDQVACVLGFQSWVEYCDAVRWQRKQKSVD